MTITKLTIPLMVFGPIFAAAIGAGGTFAATKAKLDENAAKTERLEKRFDVEAEKREKTTIEVTEIKVEVKESRRLLERLNDKLDRMAR